jgi:uncharacterized metal-binding protein YceD (DUF177 family)
MKIHLRQIPEDGLHMEGEEAEDLLDLPSEEGTRLLSPVRYALDLGLDADGLWATGELSATVELRCVRCLTPFRFSLEVPDVALQVERPAAEMVDLTPHLREDILLALPAYPHCDWSGERVCPGRLAAQEEAAPLPQSEERSDFQLPSAWATLDQLKTPPQKSS